MALGEPRLTLLSDAGWSIPEGWFGGFSGMEMSSDGRQIILVTDKGTLVEAAMIREDEILKGLQVNRLRSLRHANGQILRGDFSDAEGLSRGRDGQLFISFEHRHRVARLDLATARTFPLDVQGHFSELQPNAGLEALATHPDGTIYTLPERSKGRTVAYDLYARNTKGWRITHQIPRRGPFLPVGADFDHLSRLYLLERAVTPLGFRSRIRRFTFGPGTMGEETLLTTSPSQFDNLEALSLWQDAKGRLRLTMISDDNFLRIQRTQIVEYLLDE